MCSLVYKSLSKYDLSKNFSEGSSELSLHRLGRVCGLITLGLQPTIVKWPRITRIPEKKLEFDTMKSSNFKMLKTAAKFWPMKYKGKLYVGAPEKAP